MMVDGPTAWESTLLCRVSQEEAVCCDRGSRLNDDGVRLLAAYLRDALIPAGCKFRPRAHCEDYHAALHILPINFHTCKATVVTEYIFALVSRQK